ncbi:MAG: hypothetical protein QXR30_02560 [Candidatus Woesearchaeota archaeon]
MLAKQKALEHERMKTSKDKEKEYLLEIEKKVVKIISHDPDYERVVLELKKKSNYSEFELAEKLKLEMTKLRKILYTLFEQGLLFWRRKKDRQKGWYVYYWTLREDQFPFYYKKYLMKKIDYFKNKLAVEEKMHFFMCPNFCMRLSYEDAIEMNFSCPECGSILVEQDNRKTLENLKNQISELEDELKKLEKSNLLNFIAKNYDEWTSSENLFAKTKRRGVEKEADVFDLLLNDVAPETVIFDFSEEEEPSGF